MNKNFILFDFICGVPHDALMQITRLMFIQYVWNDWSNATKWYEWNCFVIRVGYFSPWSTSYLWRKVFIFCLGCTLNWLTICSEFPDMHYFLHSCSATVAKHRDCRWISHSNFNTKTVTTSFSGPWGRIWISWLLGVKLILSILTFFARELATVFSTLERCAQCWKASLETSDQRCDTNQLQKLTNLVLMPTKEMTYITLGVWSTSSTSLYV